MLRWPVYGPGAVRADGTTQHAGKGLAARAMQERTGCRRTFLDHRASSEEQEGQRTGRPPGKVAS